MRKQMKVSTLDPFTLLNVLQILREISCEGSLELTIERNCKTDDLFQILSPEKYRIVTHKSETKQGDTKIIIRKITCPCTKHPYSSSNGGGCCS